MGDDKFLIVAIVMAIIFIGLAVYLVILDIKLSKIERRQRELSKRTELNPAKE